MNICLADRNGPCKSDGRAHNYSCSQACAFMYKIKSAKIVIVHNGEGVPYEQEEIWHLLDGLKESWFLDHFSDKLDSRVHRVVGEIVQHPEGGDFSATTIEDGQKRSESGRSFHQATLTNES